MTRRTVLTSATALPLAAQHAEAQEAPTETRYQRGLAQLEAISGPHGAAVVRSLDDIAPDLGRYIVEFAYGDVFSRDGLDVKTREIATVAARRQTRRNTGPVKHRRAGAKIAVTDKSPSAVTTHSFSSPGVAAAPTFTQSPSFQLSTYHPVAGFAVKVANAPCGAASPEGMDPVRVPPL